MNKIILNILEFFLVLAGMFLLFTFLSRLLVNKCRLDRFVLAQAQRSRLLGAIAATLLGAITPFCVCTTIPMFTALLQLGLNTSAAISFLFSSPLLSFSAIALLFYLFGLKFALYFTLMAAFLSVLGGLLVFKLNLESGINEEKLAKNRESQEGACRDAWGYAWMFLKQLLLPLFIGALIAGFIHNYVPTQFIARFNHLPLYLAVPFAALVGFPIYSNILILAPVCLILLNKGMDQAAVMTFLVSGAGISFPTSIVLFKIFKARLFIYYLVYTFSAYCFMGFIFNFLK